MAKINQDIAKFFLGTHSPKGFVSRFGTAYSAKDGWRTYILKGGPGTGKSTLIKQVAAKIVKAGHKIELVPCSSDPDSSDGLIIPSLKVFMCDGTAPHVVEPVHPGACEQIINLGEFWNAEELHKQITNIIPVQAQNSALHARVGRMTAACGELLSDNYRIALDCLNSDKVVKYAHGFAKREIKPLKNKKGSSQERFLSAVTPHGHIFLADTIEKHYKNIIVIDDDNGAASRILLSTLKTLAIENGYDIITCMCPFAPLEKIEHILIPELSMAICTENKYLQIPMAQRHVHARRFTRQTELKQYKQRMTFNKRAVRELINSSVTTLQEAKKVHDILEGFYIKSCNYDKLPALSTKLANEILKLN